MKDQSNRPITDQQPERLSELDRFNITFEYDKTLGELKREMKLRATN